MQVIWSESQTPCLNSKLDDLLAGKYTLQLLNFWAENKHHNETCERPAPLKEETTGKILLKLERKR